MSFTWQQLKTLSDEELVECHDLQARNTAVGVNFYLAELRHRDLKRLAESQQLTAESMERMTKWIARLTILIAALTVVNVGVMLWAALL